MSNEEEKERNSPRLHLSRQATNRIKRIIYKRSAPEAVRTPTTDQARATVILILTPNIAPLLPVGEPAGVVPVALGAFVFVLLAGIPTTVPLV